LLNLESQVEQQTQEREDKEVEMVEMFKDILKQI
jgi:hypothetical protein